ncbi:MAG TPA: TIGR03936 family radical SAM-associated protein, partial [Acidimicrobiales bacterium]
MRIRLRYRKLGKVRFTSHRDIARCWERALRRAELPIASTEGFSPRPKMHFGLALSTGHESLGEYLDVDLREPEAADVDLGALPERLTPLLPPGVDVEAVAVIDRSQTSLQEAVTSCTWVIEVPGTSPEALAAAADTMLSATELPVIRERKGKKVADDLRPGILRLDVVGATPPDVLEPGAVLQAELATHPRSVRPAELLAAFDPPLEEGRVRRTHQWITSDGATREPLSPGAPSSAR